VDFVVVGLGIGAIVAIAGFFLRDLAPVLIRRSETGDMMVAERRRNSLSGVSSGLCAAGAVIIAATVAGVLIDLSDSAGYLAVAGGGAIGAVLGGAIAFGVIRSLPVGAQQRVRAAAVGPQRAEAPGHAVPTPPETHVPRPDGRPTAVTRIEPLFDEPFDVTRLLPEEFGEHLDDTGPFEAAAIVTPEGPAPGSDVAIEHVLDELAPAAQDPGAFEAETTAPVEVPELESTEPPERAAEQAEPAEMPSGPRLFESPLFAGIAPGAVDESLDRPFTSALLADVQAAGAGAGVELSSLLADWGIDVRDAGDVEAGLSRGDEENDERNDAPVEEVSTESTSNRT
jgi:hypothetical protein